MNSRASRSYAFPQRSPRPRRPPCLSCQSKPLVRIQPARIASPRWQNAESRRHPLGLGGAQLPEGTQTRLSCTTRRRGGALM